MWILEMYSHENGFNMYHICCWSEWRGTTQGLALNNIPMTYNITSREKKSRGKIRLH